MSTLHYTSMFTLDVSRKVVTTVYSKLYYDSMEETVASTLLASYSP